MQNPYSFERVANIYDATRSWPPAVATQIGAATYTLLAPLAAHGPLRVIEVGAGTGRMLAPLAAHGAWAVGADIAPAMLQLMRAKRPARTEAGRLYAVLGDAHHLPFAAATFDVGLLVHILHLIGDWRAGLTEMERLVRPGGVLAFGVDRQEAGDQGWIDARWQALLAEAGGTPGTRPREVVIEEALAGLGAQGYNIQPYTLARWTETYTLAETVERHRGRYFASSWTIPDSVLEPAVAQLTAELLARYGSLDIPLSRECWFQLSIARR